MAISIPYILCSNFLIVSAVIGSVLISHSAYATSCQVYPSEYAYQKDSVETFESASANCRNYPPDNLQGGNHPEYYIHCNGTQLKLVDSTFGQTQHRSRDYYARKAGIEKQLLFIFLTTVSLTTITLHYYSDNVRRLPRLRFYAVPDDFDVWNNPNMSYSHVDNAAPSGQEPAGRRNVSINVNFNTKRVLMYIFSSMFQFEVSEVEFFSCNCSASTSTESIITTDSTTPTAPTSTASIITTDSNSPKTGMKPTTNQNLMSDTIFADGTSTSDFELITTSYDPVIQNNAANSASAVIVIIGISVAILIILTAVVVITLVLLYLRKSTKSEVKSDYDDSYSTLCRMSQQLQPCSQQAPTDFYNWIQLSPSTGQAEVISSAEIENINSLPLHQTDNPPNPDKEQSRQSNVSISVEELYTAVNKKPKNDPTIDNDTEATPPIPPHTVEELYTAVQKGITVKDEEEVPPIPPHTVEELYTAVQKGITVKDEEEAPPLPPHTVEELYTAVQKGITVKDEEEAPPLPPHTVEELYTAVQKGITVKDEEEAPPLPPYTVEELYTTVQNVNTVKDEEEAPPLPPYTVEDCC